MKAIRFQSVERVVHGSIPDPRIEDPRDALVRVELAGICGSDLHVYHGRETGLDPGTVLGHEFVGEIVELGSDVRRLTQGAKVVSPFTTSCGDCWPCQHGLTSRCVDSQLFGWRENGVGLHGAQAELVRVPLADSTLVPVPEDVTPEAALLAGDVLSTGFFCAEQGEVGAGSIVAVVGCGPVGLMAVVASKYLGAERVFAVDRVAERLTLAERFGAETVDLRNTDPVRLVRSLTSGRGADVVLEAVGSAVASRTAIELVRAGGIISAVGVHTEPHFAFSPTEAYDRNLTYRIGRCPARRYLDITLPILAKEPLEVGSIISHRLPLSHGVRAYRIFSERIESCTKVVLCPGDI